MREPGLYIVRVNSEDELTVGEWDGENWQFIGDNSFYIDEIVDFVGCKIVLMDI